MRGSSKGLGGALADALQGAEVDQDIGEGVEMGDGLTIADLGPLDTEFDRLTVDALGGGALAIEVFVGLAIAVELMADASAGTGGEGGDAATLGPVFVLDGTS